MPGCSRPTSGAALWDGSYREAALARPSDRCLGGVIGGIAGWRALFFGTLALALALIPGALRVLSENSPGLGLGFGDTLSRIDLLGGSLFGAAVGLFLLGVTRAQTAGVSSPSSWGAFLLATLAAVGFAARIRSAEHPFAPPALFRNTGFLSAALVSFCIQFSLVSVFLMVPLTLSTTGEFRGGAAGLVLAPGALAVGALSHFVGRFSDRAGVRLPVRAGLALMLVSLLYLSALSDARPSILAAGVIGVGLGYACVNSPATSAATGSLPQEDAGVSMGIYQSLFYLGGGTGAAVTGALLAARQTAGAGALNPLHQFGDAAPFSDVFLALCAAPLLALAASLALRETGSKNGEISQKS